MEDEKTLITNLTKLLDKSQLNPIVKLGVLELLKGCICAQIFGDLKKSK